MDLKSALNRAKNRLRYRLAASKWIKRLVPAGIRHRISGRVMDALAPETEKPRAYEPGKYPAGINLYGFFRAENGLGQAVKMYARALEERGIPHRLINTDCLDWLRQEDRSFEVKLSTEPAFAVNAVHVNPDQWQEATGMFPRGHFDGHYNIGIWIWELETIPESWKPMFDYVDEIWTPSEFAAGGLRKATGKPVTVIPYGVEAPYDESLTRADFGLKEEDFLVLMMYDSNSYASRKNPEAAIEAFREAYGEQPEGAKLVIKISNPKAEDIALIRSRLEPEDYILITERMERKRLNSLIRLTDVYLSLHRSEGFGLVLAEAMTLGTATVATGWSANTEFMPEGSACLVGYRMTEVGEDYQGAPEGSQWAEPDVQQAARYLKRLKEEKGYRNAVAQAGRKAAAERLSVRKCAERIEKRLEEIPGEETVLQPEPDQAG